MFVTRGQTLQYTLTDRKQTNITQLGGAMFILVGKPNRDCGGCGGKGDNGT